MIPINRKQREENISKRHANQTVKREQSRIGSFPQGESAPMIPGTEEHTSNEKENTRGT